MNSSALIAGTRLQPCPLYAAWLGASHKGRQERVSGERSGLSGVRGTAGRADGAGKEPGGEGREEIGDEGILQLEVAFRPLRGGYGVYARGRPRGGGTTGG